METVRSVETEDVRGVEIIVAIIDRGGPDRMTMKRTRTGVKLNWEETEERMDQCHRFLNQSHCVRI